MNEIVIYKTNDQQTEVEVQFDGETVWLSLNQISVLFERDKSVISRHLKNIFDSDELDKDSVVAKNATTASDGKKYIVDYYNFDAILSIGYRVNSKVGTQFRQWASKRLKEYLIEGYSINEKRLVQKEQVLIHLKNGIQILNRALEQKFQDNNINEEYQNILTVFTKGLELLDKYDHQELDSKGLSTQKAVNPSFEEYMQLINEMRTEFNSDLFGKTKDDSFQSSINQIFQSFDGLELYPSLQEKAAMLLYLIVKNHSFIDGNKRIAAACFLLFLEKNEMIFDKNNIPIISNEALAALTLFVASSNSNEMETVKNLIISILNQ